MLILSDVGGPVFLEGRLGDFCAGSGYGPARTHGLHVLVSVVQGFRVRCLLLPGWRLHVSAILVCGVITSKQFHLVLGSLLLLLMVWPLLVEYHYSVVEEQDYNGIVSAFHVTRANGLK